MLWLGIIIGLEIGLGIKVRDRARDWYRVKE